MSTGFVRTFLLARKKNPMKKVDSESGKVGNVWKNIRCYCLFSFCSLLFEFVVHKTRVFTPVVIGMEEERRIHLRPKAAEHIK